MSLGKRGGISGLLALALMLGIAASASATVRHASPGASGPEPCASASPCSLYDAINGSVNGDEVIVSPGEYTDTAGDLGGPAVHQIQIPVEVDVRGEAGKPRPTIVLEQGKWVGGALNVNSEDVVAHLEIRTAVADSTVSQFGGVIEDMIARNTAASVGFACALTNGTMRDTACLAGGTNKAALGGNISGAGTVTATLRNVTAIATGAGGVGLLYAQTGDGTITVDAKSVIAKGVGKDVVAKGLSTSGTPGTGGHVTINLDHSVFGSSETETDTGNGSTEINPTNSINVIPLLAVDGYHQLKGSPTVNAGALDVASGTKDVDGQDRAIGAAPDVGADELGHQTSLALACDPLGVVLTDALPGSGSDCTATVTDLEEGVLPFTGDVSFSSNGKGDFTAPSCTLSAAGLSDHAACAVNYKPKIGSAGSHTVTAVFPGDGTHDGSQGTASVTVEERPFGPCPGVGANSACPQVMVPIVKLGRKPAKKGTRLLAKFTFSAIPADSTFECRLDQQKFKPCHSPYKHKVKLGRHRFAVRALGDGGTSKPATYGWKVKPALR